MNGQSDKDPLVPLKPDRLDEARKAVPLSIRGLALRARVRQQTVDAMIRAKSSGKPRRCRRSSRDRLAEALGLPRVDGSLWLGGELSYLLDELSSMPAGGVYIGLEKSPTGVQLARYHLLQRCLDAWVRDAERRYPSSGELLGSLQPSQLRQAFFRLQEALVQLTKALWWRGQLLKPEVPEYRFEDNKGDEVEPDESFARAIREATTRPVLAEPDSQDKIERALITVLETVLEPWLENVAELDYENFLALGSRRWWEHFSPYEQEGED